MTKTEKETIFDALDMGIAISEAYIQKINYLYENHDDVEKRNEYYTQAIDLRRKIQTLYKLRDQYK